MVIDPHHNAVAIAQIDDPHLFVEGECSMGSRQRAVAEALTIDCCSAVKRRAIPAGHSLNHLDLLARNG